MILYVIYLLLAFYAAANIIYRKLDPVKSLSWVVVIFALPYIGLFLYTFLGQNFRKIKITKVVKSSPESILDLACGTGDLTIS